MKGSCYLHESLTTLRMSALHTPHPMPQTSFLSTGACEILEVSTRTSAKSADSLARPLWCDQELVMINMAMCESPHSPLRPKNRNRSKALAPCPPTEAKSFGGMERCRKPSSELRSELKGQKYFHSSYFHSPRLTEESV